MLTSIWSIDWKLFRGGLVGSALLAVLAWFFSSPVVYAGDWDSAIGEARALERVARDARKRLERIDCDPNSAAAIGSVEHLACQLVERLSKDNPSTGEVQSLFREIRATNEAVQSRLLVQPNVILDHAACSLLESVEFRMTELRMALRRSMLACQRETIKGSRRTVARRYDSWPGNAIGNAWDSGWESPEPLSDWDSARELRNRGEIQIDPRYGIPIPPSGNWQGNRQSRGAPRNFDL